MVLTSLAGQGDLPRWFEPFFATLQRIAHGSVEIGLPDGRVFRATSGRGGPEGRIDIGNPDFFARMVRDGEIALPEMYMDGWWETPDLQALLDVIVLNNETIEHDFHGTALVRTYERLRHWLRANTRRGARRNISHHYDLGNEFYRFWLDETMTYSSALFSNQGETLSEAQTNKYAAICDRLELRPGDHVLEIGCGWGGFAEYAIAQRKARVTGLTLSREQQDFARRRLFEAGLAEHAEIALRDYRDERGHYDAIASIEMFEAVGEKYWPIYFATLRDRLVPGRMAALQVITIAERWFDLYRRRADFIQKYIFPGGMLPSSSALWRQSAAAGLEIVGSAEFGDSYSRTLREWREAFNARWRDIARLSFDARFSRMWNFYLASCAACFQAGTTNVMQLSLRQRL